jgi:hypothetical protein
MGKAPAYLSLMALQGRDVLNTFLHHLLWGGGKWLSPKVRPTKKRKEQRL